MASPSLLPSSSLQSPTLAGARPARTNSHAHISPSTSRRHVSPQQDTRAQPAQVAPASSTAARPLASSVHAPSEHARPERPENPLARHMGSGPQPSIQPSALPHAMSGVKEVQRSGDSHTKIRGQSSRDSVDSRRSARRVGSIDGERNVASQRPGSSNGTAPDPKDAVIKLLKNEIDGLRGLMTCKICTRMMYEPYTVSCGHTFCYSCLCQWFTEHRTKKNCPECRCDVSICPAPAYLVRETVETLISKTELLPPDETVEEHTRLRKEESERLDQDKAKKDSKYGGLFRGCFREVVTMRAVRDESDGVDRCPVCFCEIEDRQCGQCGMRFSSDGAVVLGRGSFSTFSDYAPTVSYFSDEDLDTDMDMSGDYYGYDVDVLDGPIYSVPHQIQREMEQGNIQRPARPASRTSYNSRIQQRYTQSVSDMYSSETGSMATLDEEDEEDEETESMQDFIVNDDSSSLASGGSHMSSSPSLSSGRSLRSTSVRSSHDNNSQDDEYDEGGPIGNGRRRPQLSQNNIGRLGRGPIALPNSTGENGNYQDVEEDQQSLLRSHGWNRLGHDDLDEEMGFDDDDDDDARTTVGSDPISFANERSRLGGSITPTADRPFPQIRPPSRSVNRPGRLNTSRGLRRKSSTVSVSTHEDGDADDDDSDPDALENMPRSDLDGDVEMRTSTRIGSQRMPSATASTMSQRSGQVVGQSVADPIDVESSDSESDQSIQPPRRRRVRAPEYNPRISQLLAQHQSDINNANSPQRNDIRDPFPRTRTPLARPRTANRNRGPAPVASPSSSSQTPDANFAAAAPYGNHHQQAMMSGRQSRSSNSAVSPSLQGSEADGDLSATRNTSQLFNNALDTISASNQATSLPPVDQNSHFSVSQSPTSPRSAHSFIPLDRPSSRASNISASGNSGTRYQPQRGPFNPNQYIPNYRISTTVPQSTTSLGLNYNNPWHSTLMTRQSYAQLGNAANSPSLHPSPSRSHLSRQPTYQAVGDPSMGNHMGPRRQGSRQTLHRVPSHHIIHHRTSNRQLAMQAGLPNAGHMIITSTIQPAPDNTRRPPLTAEQQREVDAFVQRRRAEIVQSARNASSASSESAQNSALGNGQRRPSGSSAQGASFSDRTQVTRDTPSSPINVALERRQSQTQPLTGNRASDATSRPGFDSVASSTGANGSVRAGNGHSLNGNSTESPTRTSFVPRAR